MPQIPVHDESAVFRSGACNYIAFYLSNEKVSFKFHILFSLLAPCHTILVTLFARPAQSLITTCDHEDAIQWLQENGIEQETVRETVEFINRAMIESFHSEPVTMKGLNKIILPDLATQNIRFGALTLFDCLFTDQLLVY